MDYEFFKSQYPSRRLETSVRLNCNGIGDAKAVGWAYLPFWVEGSDSTGNKCLIEMHAKFHMLPTFEPKVLVGMETLSLYGIALNIPESTTSFLADGLKYSIHTRPDVKFQSVLVCAKKDVLIGGRVSQKVPIRSFMAPGTDYVFEPYHVL